MMFLLVVMYVLCSCDTELIVMVDPDTSRKMSAKSSGKDMLPYNICESTETAHTEIFPKSVS